MKTSMFYFFMAISLALFSPAKALALTIDDVSIDGKGAPDALFHYDTVSPSNAVNELDFISKGLAKVGITFDSTQYTLTKWDFSEPGDDTYNPALGHANFWTNLSDAPDLWAFDFHLDGIEYDPLHFLIKTGKNTEYDGSLYSHFLYENVGSLQYGVVDLSVFGQGGIDLYRISHVSIPAPEPSTFLLLASGLAGLGIVVRRRNKR